MSAAPEAFWSRIHLKRVDARLEFYNQHRGMNEKIQPMAFLQTVVENVLKKSTNDDTFYIHALEKKESLPWHIILCIASF